MKKLFAVILALSLTAALSGCTATPTGNASQTDSSDVISAPADNSSQTDSSDVISVPADNSSQTDSSLESQAPVFSKNILFSVTSSGGFGTPADCAGVEIYAYTDGTVKVFMPSTDFEEYVEIHSFALSQEDREKLMEIADPQKIYDFQVQDGEGDDGPIEYITLYDENDEILVSKGGYMPEGEGFSETYREIEQIFLTYEVNIITGEYRDVLASYC